MKINITYIPKEEKIELIPYYLIPLKQLATKINHSIKIAEKTEQELIKLKETI